MSRYTRTIRSENIDVYDILEAYNVTCPARQHAIKKLLMPGQRGAKSVADDLAEASLAIMRAQDLQAERDGFNEEG